MPGNSGSNRSTEFPSLTADLLVRANTGDETAFDELIVHVSSRLCAMTHRMIGEYQHVRRWEDTDDVLQESLVKLFRSLKQMQPSNVQAFFGLAATIVRRTLIDLSRHYYGVYGLGAKHNSGSLAEPDELPNQTDILRVDDPLGDLEAWSAFHESIEQLPESERDAFSLIWYTGLTQAQAAEVLGVSQRTIVRRMNRARILLHSRIIDTQSSDTREK